MVHVYHFARKRHLADILAEGLRPALRHRHLHSRLRQNAVYAWLTPGHDRMGYRGHADYVCLRLTVAPERCFVANMDLISAAYVNWIGAGGQPKDRALAERLVQAYDETAVSVDRYQSGLFRAPEVVVLDAVEPPASSCADPMRKKGSRTTSDAIRSGGSANCDNSPCSGRSFTAPEQGLERRGHGQETGPSGLRIESCWQALPTTSPSPSSSRR